MGGASIGNHDEARPVVARRHVADRDAAERGIRREDAVIGVDMHDVVVLDHRPVGLDPRVGAVMHRLFLAQPLEPRPQRVVLEQARRAGVKILEWRRVGFLTRLAQQLGLVGTDSGLDVHRGFPVSGTQKEMRTGRCSIPFTKLEYTRFGGTTTSILSNLLRISSQTILSCSSASRMPTQRWMPKPNDRCVRGRARSIKNS